MFRLLTAQPRRSLGAWHRAALFGAGLAALWVALQLAPESPPPPAAPAAATDRLPARTSAGDELPGTRLEGVATRPDRGLFHAGNVAALLLLLAGAAGALYLRRRRPGNAPSGDDTMEALGSLALAPGVSLRLVRAGDEVLLLGLAQGGVSLLRRYQTDEAPGTRRSQEASGDGAATPSFADILVRLQRPDA